MTAIRDNPVIPAAPAPAQTHGVVKVSPKAGALKRFEERAEMTLATVTYRLRRVGPTGLFGIVLLLAAGLIFAFKLLPQSQLLSHTQNQLAANAATTRAGSTGLTARSPDISLPTRDEVPDVVGRILVAAQSNGVDLDRGQYVFSAARDGIAAHYSMVFPVRAPYPKLREFVDQTLISMPAVAVEGLRIERKSVGDPQVEAELKLAVFVRGDQ